MSLKSTYARSYGIGKMLSRATLNPTVRMQSRLLRVKSRRSHLACLHLFNVKRKKSAFINTQTDVLEIS